MSTWQGGFTNEVATILPGSVGSTELADGAVTSVKLANDIQSDNYVPGVSGWRIRRNTGDVEFGSGTFRGSIVATSGELGTLDVTGNIFITSGDIVTLKNPGTGDAWLEISSSSEGRLQWIKRFAGPTDLPMAELGLDASGTLSMLSNSQFGFIQGSPTLPGITFRLDLDTGIYQPATNQLGITTDGAERLRITNGAVSFANDMSVQFNTQGSSNTGALHFDWQDHYFRFRFGGNQIPLGFRISRFDVERARILNTGHFLADGGNSGAPGLSFLSDPDTGIYNSGTNQIGFSAGGTIRALLGTSGFHAGWGGNGTGSGLFIWDLFRDIGNHEVLRANRGAGTQTTEVGYFASWINDPITGKRRKVKITDLAEAGVWKREWFEQIRPVFFKRVSTQQHEIGFALDHFREIDDNLKYLTTKGDEWGNSPDEFALLAVTIDYVQYLEQRVAELERKVAA